MNGRDYTQNSRISTTYSVHGGQPIAPMVSGQGQMNSETAKRPEDRIPYTSITYPHIVSLAENPPSVPKPKARWVIPSTLATRNFGDQEVDGVFHMLWGDIDHGSPEFERVVDIMDILGCQYVAHSTASSGKVPDPDDIAKANASGRPLITGPDGRLYKYRIIVPLSEPLDGTTWKRYQAFLNTHLSTNGITPDTANERTGQLCFLPNRGQDYRVHVAGGGVGLFSPTAWADFLPPVVVRPPSADAMRHPNPQFDSLLQSLIQSGDMVKPLGDDKWEVMCPNHAHHQDNPVGWLSAPNEINGNKGGFNCFHTSGDCYALNIGHVYRGAELPMPGKPINELFSYGQGELPEGVEPYVPPPPVGSRGVVQLAGSMWHTRPEWMIKDALPSAGIGCLFGPSYAGKSYAAVDLICSIATGRKWHGFEIKKPGPILYVAGEDAFGIDERIAAWHKLHGKEVTQVYVRNEGVDLMTTESTDLIIDEMRQIGAVCVVFDNSIDNMRGNPDGSEDVSSVKQSMLRIVAETRALVMFTHHTGHTDKTRTKGNTMWSDMSDVAYLVDVEGQKLVNKKLKRGRLVSKELKFKWTTQLLGHVAGEEIKPSVMLNTTTAKLPQFKREENEVGGEEHIQQQQDEQRSTLNMRGVEQVVKLIASYMHHYAVPPSRHRLGKMCGASSGDKWRIPMSREALTALLPTLTELGYIDSSQQPLGTKGQIITVYTVGDVGTPLLTGFTHHSMSSIDAMGGKPTA